MKLVWIFICLSILKTFILSIFVAVAEIDQACSKMHWMLSLYACEILATECHLQTTKSVYDWTRAFDVVPDPLVSLETIIRLGFRRILTSGQRETAAYGVELIRQLREKAGNRIVIMAGAGVNESNALPILSATGISEIHGSASHSHPSQLNKIQMGNGPEAGFKRVTDTDLVRRIVQSISGYAPVQLPTDWDFCFHFLQGVQPILLIYYALISRHLLTLDSWLYLENCFAITYCHFDE